METIVISSGKGGVGKTSMAVNLSVVMARDFGMHVALIDADIGTANVNLLFGVTPHKTIKDIQNGVDPAEVAMLVDGVVLYAGDSGDAPEGGYDISGIVEAVKTTEPEVIILDTHPGVTQSSIDAIRAGDHIVVVSTPEITSVTDTYQLIKQIRSDKKRVSIVMNESDRTTGYAKSNLIMGVAKIHLDRNVHYLGHINESRVVKKAILNQVPFYVTNQRSRVAGDLVAVCNNLLLNQDKGGV